MAPPALRDGAHSRGLPELRSFFDAVAADRRIVKSQLSAATRGGDGGRAELARQALMNYDALKAVDGRKGFDFSAFVEVMGDTRSWLEYEFGNVVGLTTLKDQIMAFYTAIAMDRARAAMGHAVDGQTQYHMIFKGNPGTGKTHMGRLMAKLLHRLEITKTDTLVEVQRGDLVATHIGQTAPKTRERIDEAKEGLLFVDEAYRLAGGGEKDFGQEAIEELMSAMLHEPGKAPVQVFAGYVDDMDRFIQTNAGLYRRFQYTFDFTDYSPSELAEIVMMKCRRKGVHTRDSFCLTMMKT